MGPLAFRTAVKPPVITSVTATSTSQLDPIWTVPAGFTIALTELEFSLNGSTGWTPIYSGTALTFAHTGRTANTTYYYRARVRDSQGNYSLYSSVASQTTPSGNYIKWHPGHGLYLGGIATATALAYQPSWISETASISAIKHIMMRFYWGAIEPTRDNYQFQLIDDLFALCEASGKRLILGIQDTAFSSGSLAFNISNGRLPQYIRDDYPQYGANGGYAIESGGTPSIFPQRWRDLIMDRIIAFSEALAARYDSEAMFEAFATDETGIGVPDGGAGYTDAGYLTQFKRYITTLKEAWAHTNVLVGANSGFNTLANRTNFFQHLVDNRMVFSGPDIRPNDFLSGGSGGTLFQRIYLGLDGGHNYVGEVACGPEVQGPNLGGNHTPTVARLDPTTLLDFIYTKSQNPLACSYLLWLRKTFGSPDGGTDNDVFWTTAAAGYVNNLPTIKTWLSQSPALIPVVTAAPANYAGYALVTS